MTNQLIEIRWHGRGGQGAVTSAELVAQAAISEGKFGQAFPAFGPERRGAPVMSFVRISNQRIRIRAEIIQPDIVVVLDPSLITVANVASGLKPEGTLIINTTKTPDQIKGEFGFNFRIATIDATGIAKEILGVPITNTTMVGALIKANNVVRMESMIEPLNQRFGRIAEKNLNAMKKSYELTTVKEKQS